MAHRALSALAPELYLGMDAYEPPPMAARAARVLADFSAMLEKWIAQNEQDTSGNLVDLLDTILEESGYVDALRDGSDEAEDRFANIQELRGVAAQYVPNMVGTEEGQTPLGLFLEEISLVSDIDDYDAGSGAVTLLTLHTAKGLEFPAVFIVGMEDGILPHSRSIEAEDREEMDEERRLCYVGMTRAMRSLYLVHTFRRTLWGNSEVQAPSRFFDEIPTHLLDGMVDQQGRREASFERATSWDSGTWWDESDSDSDSRASGQSQARRTQSVRSQSGRQTSGSSARTRSSSSPTSNTSQTPHWMPESTQSQKPEPQAASQFRSRDCVQHAKFGVGTVIESKVTNGSEEVTVAFPGIGIKRLMASYAGLKKL